MKSSARSVLRRLILGLVLIFCTVVAIKGSMLFISSGTWQATGVLSSARVGASAALLPDGRILVAGGDPGSGPVGTVDIFNVDGTISAGPSMTYPRSKHVSVVLADGRVLVAGGVTVGGSATSTAEIFDPVANTWSPIGIGMNEARSAATVVLMQDGRVLIAGGQNGNTISSTLETFDPNLGTFTPAGMMSSPRTQHATTLLQDGRVLIVGGFNGSVPLASTDIFDPVANTVSAGPELATARFNHSATTLLSGVVVVVGGNNGNNDPAQEDVTPAEIADFTQAVPAFTTLSSNLATPREGHLALLLPNNNSVLIVGGTSGGTNLASAELLVPSVSPQAAWTYSFLATGTMLTPRTAMSASANQTNAASTIMQRNGVVAAAGGSNANGTPLNTTEAYGYPTVQTDQSDYPPGTTVTITGSGFQPNEAINIQLLESPLIDTHGPYTIQADANGNFVDQSFTTDDHDQNIRFFLTVAGGTSGYFAQNTFTDSKPNTVTVGTQSPDPIAPTGAAQYSVTVGFNGSVNSCTSPLSIQTPPSLPTGATASFNPSSVTNTSPTSTLTITTTNSTPPGSTTFTVLAGNGTGCQAGTATGTGTLVIVENTTTTLASSVNPTVFGQSTTLTATVTQTSGTTTPTGGTVSFKDGANTLGTVNLSNGTAALPVSNLTVSGSAHGLTASYSGVANTFGASNSNTVTQTVNEASTTTTVALTSGTNPSTFGQSLTFTATVTPQFSGTGISEPSGTVTFKDGATVIGTMALTGSSPDTATFTASTLAVGPHSVTATYNGDTNYLASTSSALGQTVNQAASTTTLSSTPNPSVFGQAVTFTATVSGTGGTPTGTVNFEVGGTTISGCGAQALNKGSPDTATCTISSLATGSDSITAIYNGDTNFNGSTSSIFTQTVNQASTTTSLTASPTSSVFGQSVTFTASIVVNSPGTGTIPDGETVTFKDGGTTLGTVTTLSGSAAFTTSALTVMPHSITAVYAGDTNFKTSTSNTDSYTVSKASTTTTITNDLSSPTVVGQAYTVSVSVTINLPGSGTIPNGDTVNVSDGFATCTVVLSSEAGSCSLTSTTAGAKTIIATYNGDTNFNTSTSTGASHTVNKASTTTTITSNTPNPSTVGQAVTINYSVSVTAPGLGTPTGNVTVSDGAGDSCTGTVAAGMCQISFNTAGTKTLTATYAGDSNFNGNPSSTVNQTVNPKLAFRSTAFTTLTGLCSPQMTIQIQNGNATPATLPTSLTLNFLASSGTGQFFSDSACKNVITTATITAGSSTASVFFDDITIGTPTITVSATGLTSIGQTETITGLRFGSTAFTVAVNACSPAIFVQSANSTGGAPISLTQNTTISLSGAVKFFSDPACTTQISGTTIGPSQDAGHDSPNFYLESTSAGPVTITASAGTAAAQQTETVSKANTTTSVTTSGSPTLFGQSVTFTATVTVNPPATGTPTGTVSFYDGGTSIGTGSLNQQNPDQATFTTSSLSVASHTITAEYTSGDSNFNASPMSSSITQTVTGTPPQITSASSATFTAGTFGTFTVTTTGAPKPSLNDGATTLPTGITFTDNGDGTATMSGTATAAVTTQFTITASNGVSPNATQLFGLMIAAGPITHLALTPATSSITAGSSQGYTAQGLDFYNNTAGDVTAATTFVISPDGSCTDGTNPASCTATVADVSGSSHTVTGTYMNSAQGTATLTVNPASPTQLVITSKAFTIIAGQCSGTITVTSEDQYNNTSNVSNDTQVDLSTVSATGKFYSDGACQTPVVADNQGKTSIKITSGKNSQTFSYTDTTLSLASTSPAFTTQITAADDAKALSSGTQNETILQLAFTTAPFTVTQNTCSSQITLTAENASGTPANITVAATLGLTSTSTGATFSSDTGCTSPLTPTGTPLASDVTIASASNTISFSYQDSMAGNPTISATIGAYSITQQEEIGTPPKVTTNPSNDTITYGADAMFTAGASGSPTPSVQWQVSPDGSTWMNVANGGVYSGATTTTLTLTRPPVSLSGMQYRAVFTNPVGNANTTAGLLTIAPEPLTVSIIGNPTKPYDGTTGATLTSASFSISGLIGTDNFTVTQTSGTYATANAGIGISVTASLSANNFTPYGSTVSGNYSFPNSATGTGTIQQKSVTPSITASDKTYDGTNGATITSCTIPGKVGNDDVACSVPVGDATFASSNASLNPQTVTATGITLTGNTASNYTLSSTTATTTAKINQAMLTITASSGAFIYGGTPSIISAMYMGFVNNENAGNLTTQPVCVAAATSASPVGSYMSSCSGAVGANYSINYVPGTVMVTPATAAFSNLTVSQTVPYGTASIMLSGSISAKCGMSCTVYPPTTEYVTIGINGVSVNATIGASGAFSTNFDVHAIMASNTPYTITYSYNSPVADANFTSATDISTTLTVNPASTSTAVTSSENPSTYGDSVMFTATVSDTTTGDTATPTGGNVQFVIDGMNIGSPVAMTNGTATSAAITNLTAGQHVVTAVFTGDTDFSNSRSSFFVQTVNNPLASIAVTPANSTIVVGQTEQFTATGTFKDSSSAILPPGSTWAMGNAMTNPVSGPMAATGPNALLYLFGGQDAGGAESFVQIYSPATGTWNTGSSANFTARYAGLAVAPGDGKIYVIGGLTGTGTSVTNAAEAYDPLANAWSSKATAPNASGCLVGGAINGQIYVLSGCSGTSYTKELDVYNPSSNSWNSSPLSSPTSGHAAGAATVINGKLYVAGGYDTNGTVTGTTERYDPQTNAWTTMTAMPTSLAQIAGVTIGERLYIVGGLDGSNNEQASVYVYDPSNDPGSPWATLSASLSAPRTKIGLVAADGLLYAVGGSGSGPLGILEVLDTDNLLWSSDNSSFATIVKNSGSATGVNPGTANISASSATYSVTGSTPLTVNKADTTTSVSSSASPSTYGQAVTFTATVTVNPPGAGTPGGTVTFEDGGVALAGSSTVTLSGGTASFTTMSVDLATGSHTITAVYNGDTDFNATSADKGSIANAFTQVVNQALPVFSNLSSQIITYGTNSVTLTGMISANCGAAGCSTVYPPSGEAINVTIGGASGSGAITGNSGAFSVTVTGTAALMVPGLPYPICYKYGGDTNFNSATDKSTTLTIQKATPTFSNLTASQTVPYGTATITVSGKLAAPTATPPNTDSVTVSINGTSASATVALNNGMFTATVSTSSIPASATPYTITYSFAGDSNFNPANDPSTSLTVTKATPTFSNLTASQTIAYGTATITVSGKLAAPTATPPNTDSVTVSINGTSASTTVALNNGMFTATVSTSSISASATPYTITYSFAGDANFNSATDANTSLTVNSANTTATASSAAAVYGQANSVTLNASVAANAPSTATVNQGSITFTVTGSSPVQGNVANGAASAMFSPTGIPAGIYPITASYGGGTNFNASTSTNAAALTVSAAPTTTTVTSSTNGTSIFLQPVTFTATVTAPAGFLVTPVGSVTFYDAASSATCGVLGSSTPIGMPQTLINGSASVTTATLTGALAPAGQQHNIVACYTDTTDANFMLSSNNTMQTVDAVPVITFSPSSNAFTGQNVGTTSSPFSFTIANIGDAPLYFASGSPAIGGDDPTEFASYTKGNPSLGYCGSTLAAGSSCTVQVTFTPKDTGEAAAVLQLTDNNNQISSQTTTQIQNVTLTGGGLSTLTSLGSLYNYAIFATQSSCGSIAMNGNAVADSFSSAIGYSASHQLSGASVGTNGNVTLTGNATIYGQAAVDYATTGNCSTGSLTGVTESGKAKVTGGNVALNGPITFATPAAPNPPPPTIGQSITSCPSGMAGCTNTGTKTVALAPGTYGNVSVNGGTTVHVKTGSYNFNSLALTGNSILSVDSGPVFINLAGVGLNASSKVIDLSGGSIVNASGIPSNLQISYAGSHGMNLSGGSQAYATVYAPNAPVNMSGGTDFFGAIVGSTVTNSGGTAMHFDTNLTNIAAGDYLWFTILINNVQYKGGSLPSNIGQVKLYLTNSTISFAATTTQCSGAGGTFNSSTGTCTLPVPNAVVTLNSASKTTPATNYDLTNNRWTTSVPPTDLTGNTFVAGLAVPAVGFPTGIQNVSWSSAFSTDTSNITFQWQWSAAAYSAFSTTYATSSPVNSNVLGVNAEDGSADVNGTDPAGTPEAYKANEIIGFFSPAAGVTPAAAEMSAAPSTYAFATQTHGTSSPIVSVSVISNNDGVTHNFVTPTGAPGPIYVAGSNMTDFVLQAGGANNCMGMTSLTAGSSCNLYVVFAPGTQSVETAKIVINSDANNSPQSVYLTGTGQ